MEEEPRSFSRRRILIARGLAIAVDFAQIAVLPLFSPGATSPADDALDVMTAAAMIGLVGWHWSFLPSFVSELVPVWDLVPTWTAAVFLATRSHRRRRGPPKRPLPASGSIDTTLAQK
ncbi:MAG: hypothetical protein ACRD16_04790 [Thermoanaerobaculia bacterium]